MLLNFFRMQAVLPMLNYTRGCRVRFRELLCTLLIARVEVIDAERIERIRIVCQVPISKQRFQRHKDGRVRWRLLMESAD
jgi:hypothetical protein